MILSNRENLGMIIALAHSGELQDDVSITQSACEAIKESTLPDDTREFLLSMLDYDLSISLVLRIADYIVREGIKAPGDIRAEHEQDITGMYHEAVFRDQARIKRVFDLLAGKSLPPPPYTAEVFADQIKGWHKHQKAIEANHDIQGAYRNLIIDAMKNMKAGLEENLVKAQLAEELEMY